MKAQTVKNAVIVPVGAKGGFYVKQGDVPGGVPDVHPRAARAHRQPALGAGGDGQVVPPPDVVRRDGDDTYLVVAADKGTGAFSDVANALAAEYGYWLGDAFASGGSAGFDHKEMGDHVARRVAVGEGALPRASASTPTPRELTVVGIGDMSGDVFGNGLLRSPHVQAGGGVRPPARVRRSRSRSRGVLRRASCVSSTSPVPRGPTTTPRVLSAGGGVYPRTGEVGRPVRRGARRVLGVGDARARPPTRWSARSCARRSTSCGTAASARS